MTPTLRRAVASYYNNSSSDVKTAMLDFGYRNSISVVRNAFSLDKGGKLVISAPSAFRSNEINYFKTLQYRAIKSIMYGKK